MLTDADCLEEFCRAEYAGLCRYACALTGQRDEALETVQESFPRFQRLWQAGEIRQYERALLYCLARNVAIDRGRRQQTRTTRPAIPDDGELLAYLDGELNAAREAEIRQLLASASYSRRIGR